MWEEYQQRLVSKLDQMKDSPIIIATGVAFVGIQEEPSENS